MNLPGQAVEGIARTRRTEIDDFVLQRRAGRTVARQRRSAVALVARGGDVGERVVVAAHHQVYRVGGVHQRRVEERVLRQIRSAEGTDDTTARCDQRIRGVAGERRQSVHLQPAPQRRSAADSQRRRGRRADRQRQHTAGSIGQVAGDTQRARLGPGLHHTIVDHRTDAAVTAERSAAGNSDLPSQRGLSSAAADLQHALIDRYGAAERVITGQQQGAGTTFGHGAETIEATTESPVQVLLKNQRGVVENVALQTGAITDQRTATDRGATAISIGTTQYQGAGIKLLDTARAH